MKKKIEIEYRANDAPVRARFAVGPFWGSARGHPDFEEIQQAYVNGVLLCNFANVAAGLANRPNLHQREARSESQERELKLALKTLKRINKALAGIEQHPSREPIDYRLNIWSSNWTVAVEGIRRIVEKRSSPRRNREPAPVDAITVGKVLDDISAGTERITYVAGGIDTGLPIQIEQWPEFEKVRQSQAALRKIAKFCNGGASALDVALDLLSLKWPSVTREMIRKARARQRKSA